MCGVAAIFAYHYAASSVDREELRAVRDHMRNRGPDGFGEWYAEDSRVALGHRRLKIIDLSDEAAQPMVSSCGRYVISYNGEIYNYKSLRKDLQLRGHTFRTGSDTEVLLALFAECGVEMFGHLRGMYAFVIWDVERRTLWLARDPFGIKPLYYADDGWTVRVASQVKALHAGGGVSRMRNPAGQVGFLLLGSVPEPFTTWMEISSVPAGHAVRVDAIGPHSAQAFAYNGLFVADDEQTSLREAVQDSVRHHLVSDVPVGAFLSAGIDSSVLVAVMSEILHEPIVTLTVGFEEFVDTNDDERPLARQTSSLFGTQHHECLITHDEFHKDIDAIIDAMDQPSIDGINMWLVSRAATQVGLKVALSGLGADELFAGYPSFEEMPRFRRWGRVVGLVPGLGQALRVVIGPLFAALGINPRAVGVLEYGRSWAGCYLVKRGLFLPWELGELMAEDEVREGLRRLRTLDWIAREVPDTQQISNRRRISLMEQSCYMRNQLLRDTDWASMAHSLEIRVPFVDTALQRVASIHRATKGDLAQVPSKSLPRAVIERPKTGFGTPIGLWTKDPAHPAREHWSRGWARKVKDACAY